MLTPPALVVAGFVLLLLPMDAAKYRVPHSLGNAVGLLSPALSQDVGEFSAITPKVSLAQALWFAAVAATGFLLFTAARRRSRIAAVLPFALCLGLVLPLLPRGHAAAYEPDHDASALVCTEDAPRVCVMKAHEAALADLVEPARQALTQLAKLPDPPSSMKEFTGDVWKSRPQPPDVLWFDSSNLLPRGGGEQTSDDLLLRMLAGAGTRPCGDLGARAVAGAWLVGDFRTIPSQRLSSREMESRRRTWEALRALPADEQRDRVSALRQAELACQGDLLDILTKGGPR
jgi:hypothetical protein